ncbi:sodium:solute symporter family protein, partial [Candidatus Latescibacterota bacterium]
MTLSDYIVLIAYVAGVFVIGGLFGGKIKTSRDMFAAGGTSPWWVSGLSGFMTMFSAGTFVVWGGIAYKHGMVAISISLCYGVSALFVGWFIAGKWNKTGVTTAAEFIRLRFGKAALQFYTWSGMTYKLISVGVALYSVAVLISAMVTLPEGAPFRDAATGNLALNWAVLIFGGIVVVYTVVGGLWAVLMTDVLQFIVLTLAVTIVAPMILGHTDVGGISGFLAKSPDGFLSPTSGDFTWLFLMAWMAIHVFIIGGEWAFVQRFLCVPTEKDARKSSWLFGIMYLVSPVLWMLPPMAYRLINPEADPKEAYILACREVLPPGVVGLMLAAMFSATASMVDSQLNVFSGVLTRDFYRNMFRPESTEESLVSVGRIITSVLGLVLIALALAVPYLGGAENVILSVTSLIVVPLLAPTVWGLLSRRIGTQSVWLTAGICFFAGALVNFGFSKGGFLENVSALEPLTTWIQSNHRLMQQLVGVLLPILILAYLEWRSSETDHGWTNVENSIKTVSRSETPSKLPAKVVSWSLLSR